MNTYPMFRLAIPLAAGIFFAETFRVEMGVYPVVALLFLLLALGFLLKTPSYGNRWMYGAGTACFMFLVGMVLTEHVWKKVKVNWHPERQVYQGVVQETPQEKLRSYQCRVQVLDKGVLLYLPKDSLSASLEVGDRIVFRARIEQPRNKEGEQEFDYARYLLRKGIGGTAYVPAYAWKKADGESVRTLKQKALLIRGQVMGKFREWGIGDGQFPVLTALTLGYKGDLDKETRDAYSVAGISHVLALSGMHIGIVWLLLDGLLRPLMRGRLRWLKWMVVTISLWAFAFVVGLEASVVRAVVMCMLMELGRLSGSRPLSMNTLAIAAFFMLLYNPYYLFDVSFQLSFVAVASILLFYPMIFGCFSVKHRVGRWIWRIMSVSMAAQLGTAPLVMYYFSNFSVYFLFANLVAVVLVPLIIYGSILMVALFFMPALQSWIVMGVNILVGALNDTAGLSSALPYATFSLSVLKPVEVALCYILFAVVWKCWKTRKRKWLIRTLAAFACLLALHLYMLCRG